MNAIVSHRWWSVLSSLLVTVLVVALLGCAAPPDMELQNARAALEQAQAAEAPVYAEQDWSQAQSALAAAETEIDTQNEKFSLLRNYDQASSLITTATQKAEEAHQSAVAGKEKAQTEAKVAFDEAESAVGLARDLITEIETCGRTTKGMAGDLASLRGSTDALTGELTRVSSALSKGQFTEAQELGSSLEEEAARMVADLQNAMTKLGCQPMA